MRGPACWALSLALLPVAHTYLSAVRTLPSRCNDAGINHHRRHAAPSAATAAGPALPPCMVPLQQPKLRLQPQWRPQGLRRRGTQAVAMAEASASAEQQPDDPLSAQVRLGPYSLPRDLGLPVPKLGHDGEALPTSPVLQPSNPQRHVSAAVRHCWISGSGCSVWCVWSANSASPNDPTQQGNSICRCRCCRSSTRHSSAAALGSSSNSSIGARAEHQYFH